MSKSNSSNHQSRGSHPGLSAVSVSCLLLAALAAVMLLLASGNKTLRADDEDEPKVVEAEESLAPSDHAHGDSKSRIPTDAAGQRAELLRMAKQCDLDILYFGQKDQEKREAEINTFVATALDTDYPDAGDFEDLMEEIRQARMDNDNAMYCHCGKNLNSHGVCTKCTPKPNKLRDE